MQIKEDYSLHVNKKKKKDETEPVVVALPFHAPCSSSSVLSSSLKSLPGWGRQSPARFQVTLKPSDTHKYRDVKKDWQSFYIFTFPNELKWSNVKDCQS